MARTQTSIRWATALLITSVSLVGYAGRQAEFVPSRSLGGITAVQLAVKGLPTPLGESGTSEVSIQGLIQKQLEEAGLEVGLGLSELLDTVMIPIVVVTFM